MEEECLEDRFEKLQILQHDPEIWRGYVHASNGTSYGYWLSQDGRLCYLGLDYETMKERLTTIEECQRWMFAQASQKIFRSLFAKYVCEGMSSERTQPTVLLGTTNYHESK